MSHVIASLACLLVECGERNCCQALKRWKVGEDTATSTGPQALQQHQQQHCGQSLAQPCHGPGGHGHRGAAAACCAGPAGPSQQTGPLHAALNHIMPGRVMAQSECGAAASCHAPTAAPPIAPPIQAAATVAVGGGAPGPMAANHEPMGWLNFKRLAHKAYAGCTVAVATHIYRYGYVLHKNTSHEESLAGLKAARMHLLVSRLPVGHLGSRPVAFEPGYPQPRSPHTSTARTSPTL